VVGIDRFDDNRPLDLFRSGDRIIGIGDTTPFWYRDAYRLKQLFGELFILGDRLGNGAGSVGFGGPDAALVDTVAEED
jgi:hypothetical protein